MAESINSIINILIVFKEESESLNLVKAFSKYNTESNQFYVKSDYTNNLNSAVTKINTKQYDIIICYNIEISFSNFLKTKNSPENTKFKIPCIFLTSAYDRDIKMHVLQAGGKYIYEQNKTTAEVLLELINEIEQIATTIILQKKNTIIQAQLQSQRAKYQQLSNIFSAKKISSTNQEFVPFYGDLSELNKKGILKTLLGQELLYDVAREYLDFIDSSSAVYERNGDYALGIFSSGWCQFLDKASRKLCNTDDNVKALHSGNWLCHESCWTHAAKVAIEENRSVDIECHGKIRLYTEPIVFRNKVIGAINFGYGNPPQNDKELREVAKKYKVDFEELKQIAKSYTNRPDFIFDLAKRRLKIIAKLLGEIVTSKMLEQRLSEFTHVMTHDINNTLMTIHGYTSLLKENFSTTHLNRIEQRTQYLMNLLNKSVYLVQEGLIIDKKDEVNLHNLIHKIKSITFPDESPIKLISSNLPTNFRCDKEKIIQIIKNIFENALNHGKPTQIQVKFIPNTKNPDQLIIRNDGKPIPLEHVSKLFRKGFSTKKENMGLGLYIVKALVEAHGWEIEVESDADWTSFIILLD